MLFCLWSTLCHVLKHFASRGKTRRCRPTPPLADERLLELAEVDRIRRSHTKNAILLGNARQRNEELATAGRGAPRRSALHAKMERNFGARRTSELFKGVNITHQYTTRTCVLRWQNGNFSSHTAWRCTSLTYVPPSLGLCLDTESVTTIGSEVHSMRRLHAYVLRDGYKKTHKGN